MTTSGFSAVTRAFTRIAVAHLSGKRRVVVLVCPERQERVAALRHAQAQIAFKGIDVLPAHRQRIFERDGVIDIHRGRDASHRIALKHALEQVLDGAARALLRLESPVGLAPGTHRLIL